MKKIKYWVYNLFSSPKTMFSKNYISFFYSGDYIFLRITFSENTINMFAMCKIFMWIRDDYKEIPPSWESWISAPFYEKS